VTRAFFVVRFWYTRWRGKAARVNAGLKPGIDELLIASALDADLSRRLLESPEEVFQGFTLTEEEKDLLRRPDHRLLGLFGAALAHERTSASPGPRSADGSAQPHAVVEAPTLPDLSLVLTVVPCAQYEDGRLQKISYAVWVNPLPTDADPASVPPPRGAVFPGQPLTPLHAVIQVSPLAMQDADGKPLIGLSAVFRQASNMADPPPPESLGREERQAAVAAVRSAPQGERYDRLLDLLHALRGGALR
jgi:hypothetical protein